MSSFHVHADARPRVAWAIRYVARPRLAAPAQRNLDALTVRQATSLLHVLDAVCQIASAQELPFKDFAVLDGLCADLSDWLRDTPSEQPLGA